MLVAIVFNFMNKQPKGDSHIPMQKYIKKINLIGDFHKTSIHLLIYSFSLQMFIHDILPNIWSEIEDFPSDSWTKGWCAMNTPVLLLLIRYMEKGREQSRAMTNNLTLLKTLLPFNYLVLSTCFFGEILLLISCPKG